MTLTGAEGGAPVLESIESISTGCFFSKDPTQKSSKHGIGPSQQDKIAKGRHKKYFFTFSQRIQTSSPFFDHLSFLDWERPPPSLMKKMVKKIVNNRQKMVKKI